LDRAPCIFLSCGEASGERYGAALARALRAARPDVRLRGMGGPALAAAGVELDVRADALAVMGFGEVAQALPRLLAARKAARRAVTAAELDAVVPVDFPGFNLDLARRARAAGTPVYYVVAPQLWAWGAWRLKGLRAAVDRLGVLLPFEKAWFEARGVPCDALGHPLRDDYGDAEAAAAVAAREERLAGRTPVPLRVGLLPGSRRQEVTGLADLLGATADALCAAAPVRRFQFVLSRAPGVDPAWFGPLGRRDDVEITGAGLPELLPTLDLAVVCSGTASLEAALAGVPHALVYRTSALNYAVARRLVKVDHIGLPNLVLDRRMVDEHVQADARPEPVAADLARWLDDAARRARFREHRERLAARLGPPGFWRRTAERILDLTLKDGSLA